MKRRLLKTIKDIAAHGVIFSWVALALMILLSISFWYSVKLNIEQDAHEIFHFKAYETTYNIQRRMTAYKQVLLGGTGLFAASDSVKRDDWKKYVRSIKVEENYPGILGIGYSTVVPSSSINKFIKSIRNEGFPDFNIWPEPSGDIITSIIYLEPFSGRNLRAFGYDMFSESIRRKAMEAARDEGKASVTGKVVLVQETNKNVQAGFLMYIPVYKNNSLQVTIRQKRESLAGFIYSPFRMHDLMTGILNNEIYGIHLRIYDESISDSSLMYNSDSTISKTYLDKSALFSASQKVKIEGHTWSLKFISLPSFENDIDYGRANAILIGGIIISLLIFIIVRATSVTMALSRKLEQILESTGEGIYGVDLNGTCTFINNSALNMLGYDKNECLNRNMHELIHHTKKDGSRFPQNECSITKSMKDGIQRRVDTEIYFRKDGSIFPIEYFANPIIQRGEIKGSVVTFDDITERIESQREVKELAHRLKVTLESITDAFYTVDNDWKFTYLNKEAEKLLLRPRKVLLNNSVWDCFPESVNTPLYTELTRAKSEHCSVDFEVYYVPFSKWLEIHAYPSENGLTVIFRDITGRKESEEKIEASLKEKDVLLKEIHHRVKNNLQIVASLLNLQLQNLDDNLIVEILKESQNRIKSMALIHEKLYMAQNMSKINFASYVRDLIWYLMRSYHTDDYKIDLTVEIEEVNIDIDKTVSLGLAINELVSNSLKHGFTDKKKISGHPEICIWLYKANGFVTLKVKDNGAGFPEYIDFKNTVSLGLQLVNALVSQIDGDIELNKKNGTEFIITFPHN